MSPEQVRKRLSAVPFRPFALCLNSGERVRVPHPEFALLPAKPNDWEMVVFDEDQAFNIIDLAHVASLKEIRPPKEGSRRSQARRQGS